MFQHCARPIRTTSLIALPLALMALAPAAHALSMNATANWTVGLTDPAGSASASASSGSVDIGAWHNDTTNSANSVFYHTYGDDAGNFGSRSSGNGNFDIDGQYSFNNTYTASGSTSLFSFHVVPGELAFYGSAGLTGTDQLTASYFLDILLNGVSIWSSGAKLEQNGGSVNLINQVGASLGSYTAGSFQYNMNDYTNTLTLNDYATINNGDTYTIDYVLTTKATGNLTCTGSSSNTSGGGAADPTKPENHDSTGNTDPCAGAVARIGDPFGVHDVPEPSTIALLGLGLAGFGIARRRKA